MIVVKRRQTEHAIVYASIRRQANEDPRFRGRREAEQPLSVEAARRLISHSPNSVVLGAFDQEVFDQEDLTGIVSMEWMGPSATLFGLFVVPGYRRQGVARALIETLSLEATKVSCRNLKLDLLKQNKHAITLYESMGFRQVGTDGEGFQFDLLL